MKEQFSSGEEHAILEADMKRLAKEILEHRTAPENKDLSDKELLKKSLEKLVPVTSNTVAPPVAPSPLPHYTENIPPEMKLEIEYLLDKVFHEGLEKAAAAARRSHPFVIDAFHDALVTKLYPELEKRGLLPERK